MLTLEHLSVKRGTLTTADKISATFQTGKVYTILGPNGAGKSSLIKALFGEIPHHGDIRYDKQKLTATHLPSWRKRIGYMPQDSKVEAALTALEVVLLGKMDALHMHIGDETLRAAVEIMDALGIAHLAHHDITRLSGGQRQLVMFAQVLLRQPQILLLDEPVSALDMHHQLVLLEHVCHHTREQGLITLMILHDLSLAAQFSDELLLLAEGKIQAQGAPADVLQADLISRLYRVQVECLTDSMGLPVIRPVRLQQPQTGNPI
ncbi:MAG: ABC transporter ATP-binding protein [Neisseria sp.]|uniref:ABC transporter ATP-binding protein n=1 Tax=Neisseria sp. TaxID=192066 RepID=UPI0026DAE429|nr:ABC transporter ATP-binding protein [Neisseria sp.]MDO4641937.1 ABC transporter ATP-binding protein [Neisseria sp.]